VEVSECPPPARAWLAGLVRTLRGVDQAEAEKLVDQPPLRLAGGLTRGQAEDLLTLVLRERVTARLKRNGKPDA
jgi:hypothetical protein